MKRALEGKGTSRRQKSFHEGRNWGFFNNPPRKDETYRPLRDAMAQAATQEKDWESEESPQNK